MTPPKTRSKLSVEAQDELGQSRVCLECDETKEVSRPNYAPSKRLGKSIRGWSTVCRVCQGVASTEARGARIEARKAALGNTEQQVHELYTLDPRRDIDRLVEVREALAAQVLALPKRESFRLFVRILKPLVADWVEPGAIHDDIIDGLMSPSNKVLIIATRYSAKSTLTAMYVAWEIYRDPMLKVLVLSKGSTLAKRMLRVVRNVFLEHCPLLGHLKPNDECLDNVEQFQVPQTLGKFTGGATFTSRGITSDIVGLRSDLTIGDDVEGPQDNTPEKVVALEETMNEVHMINPKGRKVILGTYQSEFSLYAKWGDEGVWELHRACMFAEEQDPETGKTVYRSRWPAKYSDADAADWRRSVTTRAWRLHVLLLADPSLLNERPLKISDLIVVKHSPQAKSFPIRVEPGGAPREDLPTWGAPRGDAWFSARSQTDDQSNYAITVAAVDPASGLAGRDAIGVAVLSVTVSGQGVIRHLEGVRGPSKADNMRRVAQIIRDFTATCVVVEEAADGFFGETLEGELVILGFPTVVEKITAGQLKKGQRIIGALGPPMGASRLIILETVVTSDHGGQFVNQLVKVSYDGRTGRAKDHDDIVDALAHAVARVKDSLISSPSDNVAEHYTARIDRARRLGLRAGGITDGSLQAKLIEEDETLIRIERRRDALQEVVQGDLIDGRKLDPNIVKTIQRLTHQLTELREEQVL